MRYELYYWAGIRRRWLAIDPERTNPSSAHCRRTDRSARPRSIITTRSARGTRLAPATANG
jgi:hypothetical protein